MNKKRIYLSPPNTDQEELASLENTLKGGWVAPVGPQLDAFERQLENMFSSKRVLLVNSGTSALHLSLILANVQEGDFVLTSSFTFAACANVIRYQRAIPVFIDSEPASWNAAPHILADYLHSTTKKPKAIIITHLYGNPAKVAEIKSIADTFGIPLIEDAAEALGTDYLGKQVGGLGNYGVFSFNGNKIVTTSGGGALICDEECYQRALHLATQANKGKYEYQHEEVGYNYRMSNVLAGLGLAQFGKLAQFKEKKRSIFEKYRSELSAYIDFPMDQKNASANKWLSVGLLRNEVQPVKLIEWLDKNNIETRRVWKPLHLQPAYQNFPFIGAGICESVFDQGICLPSGTGLSEEEQDCVIQAIKSFFKNQ